MLYQPMPSPLADANVEAGDTALITQRGYAHVIADSRGSGGSEGEYLSLYSEQEGKDGYDLIEWIAEQDWCDGIVGMIGISYFATIQLVVAAERPPALRAIAPLEATTDQYLACYHGGALDCFYTELFPGRHSKLSFAGFASMRSGSLTERLVRPEEFRSRLDEARSNPDIADYNLLFSILNYPDKNPVFFDILLNPFADDPLWWYPELERIEIPVLCGGSWFPNGGPKFVRSPFVIRERVEGPCHVMMARPGYFERPFHEHHDLILDWFDRWLKPGGGRTPDEPPLRLWVTGRGDYRDEQEWPLARTEWMQLYLRTHGRLSFEPERQGDIPPDGVLQPPLSVTTDIRTLRYETETLRSDLELTGPVAAYLHVAIDQFDAMLRVQLFDVDTQGTATEVTHGYLRLSHGAIDDALSQPWRPVHPHTRSAARPVRPGALQEYAIELYPMATVFRQGHRIRLDVSSLDLPGAGFSYHVGSSRTVAWWVYRDSEHPSHLYVPVIQAASTSEAAA
jgi:predicted acyl esterase